MFEDCKASDQLFPDRYELSFKLFTTHKGSHWIELLNIHVVQKQPVIVVFKSVGWEKFNYTKGRFHAGTH